MTDLSGMNSLCDLEQGLRVAAHGIVPRVPYHIARFYVPDPDQSTQWYQEWDRRQAAIAIIEMIENLPTTAKNIIRKHRGITMKLDAVRVDIRVTGTLSSIPMIGKGDMP